MDQYNVFIGEPAAERIIAAMHNDGATNSPIAMSYGNRRLLVNGRTVISRL